MYNLVTSHLFTLRCESHLKSSNSLSPRKAIPMLLKYSLCCIVHSMAHLFYNWKFIPLFIFTFPTHLSWQLSVCSMNLFLILFVWFGVYSHISGTIWYLSFSVWLISLSIIPSRSVHIIKSGRILFLFIAV